MRDEQTLDEIHLKRSRITYILLAFATIISLIFLVFSFIQKTKADKLVTQLAATKHALAICQNSK
jgi:hypothetical protein